MGKLICFDVGCADCSIIKSKNYTFLVDCYNIDEYSSYLPSDKKIKGVFITHQHDDHFAGLSFLKTNKYIIDYLVYSPYERRYKDNSVTLEEWNDFKKYANYFEGKGTKLLTPFRQKQWDNAWWKIDGLKFFILGPAPHIAKKSTRELHDACLVINTVLDARKCLFTGDASDENLNYIAENTNNICDDILHASHHGSINGADLEFIKKCSSKYTVISTQSGVHSNVPSSTALQRYRSNTSKKVYRTDTAGTVKFSF